MGKYKVVADVWASEVLSWLEDIESTWECSAMLFMEARRNEQGLPVLHARGTVSFGSKGVLEPMLIAVERRFHLRSKDKMGDVLLKLVANMRGECERHTQTKFWLRRP